MKYTVGDRVSFEDYDGHTFFGEVFECHREPWGYEYTVRFHDWLTAGRRVSRVVREDVMRPA